MENLMGLLRIHVIKGVNLAVRDVMSSDPYVIVRMGKQKLKTRVVNKNINPVWNEDLTLSVTDPNIPIKLVWSIENMKFGDVPTYTRICQQVYDKDTFSLDDKMGDAEFDIKPLLEAVKMRIQNVVPGNNNTIIITVVKPSRQNCLAEESSILWENGKVTQRMFLRLRDVESGEVEIQLEWIDIPGSRGL